MKKPRQEKWYLGGDGEGPMIWNDRNITLAMSNTTEYAIKKNRKIMDAAFRLMARAPEMEAALKAVSVWMNSKKEAVEVPLSIYEMVASAITDKKDPAHCEERRSDGQTR